MQTRTRILGLALLSLASGCGKEMGRVPFSAVPGTGSTTAELAAGDVSFWTDIDVEWEGDGTLNYDVELSQGGAVVAKVSCNPLGRINVKSSWTETNWGAKHSRNGSGKMSCSAKVDKAGSTAVKVTFSVPRKPSTMTLKKADLVVKQ